MGSSSPKGDRLTEAPMATHDGIVRTESEA
jgi:hypothetical protein